MHATGRVGGAAAGVERMGRERGLPIRRRAMLLLLIALAIDVRGSAKAPAELQRPLLPRLDALRLRGGAPQPVPASFDQNVAELVEYLREQVGLVRVHTFWQHRV